MILSDRTIKRLVEDGTIGVSPGPVDSQYQPGSLDLRLAGEVYDTVAEEEVSGPVVLEPETPYIGFTLDEIDLPNHLAAMMTGRSSVGREGVIVHKTAGWIDPGFTGQLTLEMFNFAREPIQLRPGQRVAQLVFFRLDEPSTGYDGQYQGQRGITLPNDTGGSTS